MAAPGGLIQYGSCEARVARLMPADSCRITGLPAMHRVRPVADLGHKVLQAVPVAAQQQPTVADYRECLTESFTVPTPS
jgi:hypothetical protein